MQATAPVDERALKMRYAGGLVRHLGLQMYSGMVPAVAELIANAWDADATRVEVELPLDEPIEEDAQVTVRDNGSGMTFEDINDAYLVLGRDRRAVTGSQYTDGGRRVMGRKGIGKLAGFGIAHLVRIDTVRDGHLTAFEMDYDQIVADAGAELVGEYRPPVLLDRPLGSDDELQQGTCVSLTRLQVRRTVNGDQFRRSMARRFAVFGEQFELVINGTRLATDEQAWQFRFPEDGWESDEVPGLGPVRWWAGFTEKPIPHDDARGIAVLARGKLVQRPFFFDLSGGTQGQHGMQYLTGEVIADGLDDAQDLIATDRATVLWEDPIAQPLMAWGQALVRRLLRDWTEGRQRENEQRVIRAVPELATIDRLPARAQAELRQAIAALTKVDTIDEDRLRELVTFIVRAYDNEQFMILVRELNAADVEVGEQLARLVQEWDVQEAVSLAWIVRGRIEIIKKFEEMIREKVPEKPDLQDYVKKHPWLLDPGWDMLRHETSIDRVIREELGIDPETDDGKRRLDFFTLADSGIAVVVELKRPGLALDRDDVRQLEDYVNALRGHYSKITEVTQKRTVKGVLVGSEIKEADREYFTNAAAADIVTRTWSGLLENAERLHRDYLGVVRGRAKADDPRIEQLDADPREDISER
jgi:Histidine kinase-, DNA gyrase B-, and HSP90-like ATPase